MTKKCIFCDSTDNIEEHHVVPRRFGGTDDEKNLITLCSDCHKTVERVWDQRFYDGIGARGGMTPNLMFDALKEYQRALQQLRHAIGGTAAMYEKELEAASDTTVDDYGGTVTRRQVAAIKLEAYDEMLEGGPLLPNDPLADLEDLEDHTYRVLDLFEGGDDP